MNLKQRGTEEQEVTKKSIWQFFNPSIITLIFMVILVGMGEKLAERFLPLYLIAIGGSIYAAGFLNGLDNLLSAIYSLFGGYVSDRVGYKRALILFNFLAMFGYLLVILIAAWWAVLLGAFFFIAWTAVSLPAIMSLVSKVVDKDKRTMGVSLHSLVRRIPMALGPVVGGLIIGIFGIEDGVRFSFSIAFLLGLLAMILEIRFIEEPERREHKPVMFKQSLKNINPKLRTLLISDILVRFAEQIPYAYLAIYAVSIVGISELEFGFLTSIEMVTAMLIYLPVAYLADTYGKKPYVLTTFVFFAIFPMFFYFSRSFPVFIIAFIVRGLKEFGEPARKALIMDLAPENAKASTFGTYYLIRDVIVSLAAFSSGLLWDLGPWVNMSVATCFGMIGVFYFAFFFKDHDRITDTVIE
ncbi:MAG: MFS transporter [Candidatus Hodarchaeales archaeon]